MGKLPKFVSNILYKLRARVRTTIPYGERIPWEMAVQLAVKDFLPTGGCALDVGANIGALSVAMSRMVGARGQVHAFEANPKLYDRITWSFRTNRVTNVTLMSNAVWRTSGEKLTFYCDPSYFAAGSRLSGPLDGGTEVTVQTIALDDYCRTHRIVPDVVKIDVEGAEMDVLRGAKQPIAEHHPVIVLEYCASDYQDEDPLDFLAAHGYQLSDTNLYQTVNRQFYVSNYAKPPIDNVLAVPASHPAASAYLAALDARTSIIDTPCTAPYAHSVPIPLPAPGRYLVTVELAGPPNQVGAVLIKEVDGELLIRYEAALFQLQHPACSCLVFDIERPTTVVCEATTNTPVEAPLELRHISVAHLRELPVDINTMVKRA